MNHLSCLNPKRSNVYDNATIENAPFDFRQSANSSLSTDPVVEEMISFTSKSQTNEGSGLFKEILPQTQLVY